MTTRNAAVEMGFLTRERMLLAIKEAEKASTVISLAKTMHLSTSKIQKHIDILVYDGRIKCIRINEVGYQRFYREAEYVFKNPWLLGWGMQLGIEPRLNPIRRYEMRNQVNYGDFEDDGYQLHLHNFNYGAVHG